MAKSGSIRRITILNDVKGLGQTKKVVRSLDRIDKSARKTAGSVGFLRNAFVGFISFQGVQVLTQWSDSLQLLRDRMSVFTGSVESANESLFDLQAVAALTKTSVAGLAESYNRIALATKDLGLSSEAVLGTTLALQQTFRLSGSTIAESTASTIQLTQGLAAGALRGQELRSVLEANAVFGGLLAKQFGVTRGELIKLGETGKITSDQVLTILANNIEDLTKQAGNLGQTIKQSVTIALDDLKIRIFLLNERFKISNKVATIFQWAADNLGTVIMGLATVAIPMVINAFIALKVAILSIPIVGWVALAIMAIAELAMHWEKWKLRIERMFTGFIMGIATGVDWIIRKISEFQDFLGIEQTPLEKKLAKNRKYNIEELGKTYDKLGRKIDAINNKDKKSIEAERLRRMKEEMLKAAAAAAALKKKLGEYHEMNMMVTLGIISLNQAMEVTAEQSLAKVTEKFQLGKISIEEYTQSIVKMDSKFHGGAAMYIGVDNYIKQAGTLSQNIANGITGVFGHLEDSMVSFMETGKANFREFTEAVLKDLNRIIIKSMLIAPLADGIKGFISPTTKLVDSGQRSYDTHPGEMVSAQGNAFVSGVHAFAKGGLVDSPTLFGYGSGKTGIMGEAGTEAIMPLTRTKNGDLGVKTQVAANVEVNVINNTNAEANVQERKGADGGRILDVVIAQKVQEGFVRGTYDQTMKQTYGLNRKGR